jgi:hypothetical protein
MAGCLFRFGKMLTYDRTVILRLLVTPRMREVRRFGMTVLLCR